MNPKHEIINKFQVLVNEELEKLDIIQNKQEKSTKLSVLYKINKYLSNFDELDEVLSKFFENKNNKDKWER